ncbi:MAG: zinc dependent phospholipase C family protein [Lachnospiraceae bacterium]|nr:zinc dependent phospholipase C family protein [Lachnospiraceae bacterium]
MPSTYAHLYFGRRAERLLPEAMARAVQENRQVYEIGLHGPDILFYYQPLKSNPISRTGFAMHEEPARAFFYPARDVCLSAAKPGAAWAYLAGFLCHYELDRACHGYIEKKLTVSDRTHTEIENEFDRYLLQQEGRQISPAGMTAHIVPSGKNASVIAAFFPEVTAGQVERALRSMKFYCNLLSGRTWRYPLVSAALRLSGRYVDLHGNLMARRPLPGCEDSNLRLEKLMQKALNRIPEQMAGYEKFLRGGDFPEGFEATFGPGEGWEEIPVLTKEEEQSYEV